MVNHVSEATLDVFVVSYIIFTDVFGDDEAAAIQAKVFSTPDRAREYARDLIIEQLKRKYEGEWTTDFDAWLERMDNASIDYQFFLDCTDGDFHNPSIVTFMTDFKNYSYEEIRAIVMDSLAFEGLVVDTFKWNIEQMKVD